MLDQVIPPYLQRFPILGKGFLWPLLCLCLLFWIYGAIFLIPVVFYGCLGQWDWIYTLLGFGAKRDVV